MLYSVIGLTTRIFWLTGTKLAQAKKFNDPDDPCKILVATDAIGMGLNLLVCFLPSYCICSCYLSVSVFHSIAQLCCSSNKIIIDGTLSAVISAVKKKNARNFLRKFEQQNIVQIPTMAQSSVSGLSKRTDPAVFCWWDGIFSSLTHHSDAGNTWASLYSCMRKRADSHFHQLC